MNKKMPLLVLAAAAMLSLSACDNNPGSDSSSNEPISSSEPVVTHAVTFAFYNGTTQVVTVNDGDKVTEIEDATKPTEGYLWRGWYLGTSAYDFNTPVKSDLYLVSTALPYTEVKAVLSVQIPEGHTYSDGEFLQGGNEYVGHYMEEIDTNKYPNLLFKTFKGFTVETYELFDGNGNKVKDVAPGDKITLTDEYMTLVPTETNNKIAISYEYDDDCTFSEGYSASDYAEVEHASASAYAIPKGTLVKEGSTFIGWQIDGQYSEETYLPGEEVTASDLLSIGGDVKFVARFVSDDDIVKVSTWDELMAVDGDDTSAIEEGATVMLTADIDANGAKTAGGIGGDGDWYGTILGNGHTISNYVVQHDGKYSYGGLIVDTDDNTEVFDLKIDNVTMYAEANDGTAALIGEADDDTVVKNVEISNVKLAKWDYYDNGSRIYGNTGVGAMMGYNCGGNLVVSNVTVDGFDTSEATVFDYSVTNATWQSNTPMVGGIIGETSSGYLKLQNSTVKNSKVVTKKEGNVSLGGLIGYSDESYGVEVVNNEVINTEVKALEANYQVAGQNYISTATSYAGGLFGNMDYTGTKRDDGEATVPSEICNNVFTGDVAVEFEGSNSLKNPDNEDATYRQYAEAGLLAGSIYFEGSGTEEAAGEDEEGNTYYHATWEGCAVVGENKVEGNVTVTGTDANDMAWLGGLMGEFTTDCSNYGYVYVENNYVNANTKYTNSALSDDTILQAGGLTGSFDAEGRAGAFFYSDVVMGTINTPNAGGYISIGGVIGDGYNYRAKNFFDYIFVGAEFTATAYSSVCGHWYDDNDDEDYNYAVSNFGSNITADNKCGLGTINQDLVKGIDVSATNTAVDQTKLEKNFFGSDDNGYPVYIG